MLYQPAFRRKKIKTGDYGLSTSIKIGFAALAGAGLLFIGTLIGGGINQREQLDTGKQSYNQCSDLETRDQRLSCMDYYFRNNGVTGWLQALGVTWDDISTSNAKIDEYVLPDGSKIIRGAQVTLREGYVPGPYSCVTTDVEGRVSNWGVVYYLPQTNVGMYGKGVYVDGTVSVWADCTDWSEFENLIKKSM